MTMDPDDPRYSDDALEDDDTTFPPPHSGPGPMDHRFRANTWRCECGDLVIQEEEER